MRILMMMGIIACLALGSWAQNDVAPFVADLAAKAVAAEKIDSIKGRVVTGKDGWYFFAPELRSLSVGQFWGKDAAKVSHASNPANADPLPAILDFKAQCDKAGVELLMVPVPGKATIYPEKISDLTPKDTRTDVQQQAFYKVLADNGIQVLDLTTTFIERRNDTEGPIYCRQDSHWSPRGIEMTAKIIAERVKNLPWRTELATKENRHYETTAQELTIAGDLWTMFGDTELAKEKLTCSVVNERTAAGTAPVESWRDSPVILLGDSHCLIFDTGDDMQAKNAGLASHLALGLGFPVDLVGVRGSGATPARVNLMRRKDNLAGKKLIIWCFTVREFTEAQGWQKVPIVK